MVGPAELPRGVTNHHQPKRGEFGATRLPPRIEAMSRQYYNLLSTRAKDPAALTVLPVQKLAIDYTVTDPTANISAMGRDPVTNEWQRTQSPAFEFTVPYRTLDDDTEGECQFACDEQTGQPVLNFGFLFNGGILAFLPAFPFYPPAHTGQTEITTPTPVYLEIYTP